MSDELITRQQLESLVTKKTRNTAKTHSILTHLSTFTGLTKPLVDGMIRMTSILESKIDEMSKEITPGDIVYSERFYLVLDSGVDKRNGKANKCYVLMSLLFSADRGFILAPEKVVKMYECDLEEQGIVRIRKSGFDLIALCELAKLRAKLVHDLQDVTSTISEMTESLN